METRDLDAGWRAAHPLPPIGPGQDKDARGRVLAIGGSCRSPGAVALTAEAALRVGAGKVRIATVAPAALPVGVGFPEAGVIALPADEQGEIAAEAAPIVADGLAGTGAIVVGPGMSSHGAAAPLLQALAAELSDDAALVIDAGALPAVSAVRGLAGRMVLTPHPGELARLLDADREAIEARPVEHAAQAAERFEAVVVLKQQATHIVAPDSEALCHASDCAGLGISGSGDVLAGAIAGLLARGLSPLVAAGWGVWLHAAAGRALSRRIAPAGFLARELLAELPALVSANAPG